MGVINLTPDSFSDGGVFLDPAIAIKQGLDMAAQGAAVLDIGPESTRPGAKRIDTAEQIRRITPVVSPLRQALNAAGFPGIWISIDTTQSAVAEAALGAEPGAGAGLINDVSAGREDPGMLRLAAERGVPICLMHMQGEPGTMQGAPRYDDVVAEVHSFLMGRAGAAEQAGVQRSQIVLDPGIGFGKTLEHNLALLQALPMLADGEYPVLLGASRKKMIAQLCPESAQLPQDRLPGTLAITTLAALVGVQLIRVHDISANHQALRVAQAYISPSPRI